MAVISGLLVTQFLGTVFVVLFGAYIYLRYFLYCYWKKKGVAYLEPTVPIGNLGDFLMGKVCIGKLYADAYRKQKSNRYFGMYTIHKPCLVFADPELIQYVLTKKFNHFHDRGMYCNEKIDPLSGHLFLLPGMKWRNLRAKISPTFTAGKVKQMFGTLIHCSDKLTEYLKPKAENREIVEIKEVCARYSTDVIMETIFGISCNCLENPNNEFRYWGRRIFEKRNVMNALSMFAPEILYLFSIPSMDVGLTHFFTNAFIDTMKYRDANNISRPDFMNLMIQLTRRGYVDDDGDSEKPNLSEATGEKITMLEGAAQAFVFFFAGYETSSSTITYCLYELARNQDIQEKVMKDIDIVLSKYGVLTYENLQEMTYLHKVVSETMRMYPTVAHLNRVCTKDIELPMTNLHVSKGVHVIIPVFGIHRDPDIYPEPDKFDPERFNEENIATRHPYAYLPFGEGPRICIGIRFGYVETKLGLISILSKYRVRMGPNTPVPIEFDPGSVILAPKSGIELLIELR